MRRYLNRSVTRVSRRAIWQTRLVFWGGALMVGLAAALFARFAEYSELLFHAFISDNLYLSLVITPLGLLATAFITRKYFDGTQGSGVPQSLAVLSDKHQSFGERFLSIRNAIGKILLCSAGLLCGATVGRVGPTVHIGAAIMYSIGKYMHFRRPHLLKGLIMAGGGAGIAAAFNTPIAGIMFAIEEMGRSFDRKNISMIIIAIILAGMAAILVHDTDYHFAIVTTAGDDYLLLGVIVLICGVAGGLAGGVFSRVLITISHKFSSSIQKHWVVVILVCGFVIAITGIVSGGSAFGSGYMETKAIVKCAGQSVCTEQPDLLYPLYKFITTTATFISGIPAGLFVPTLATGAGLGRDIAMLFPLELASTIILLVMVAYYSGVMQTPITAFIVVMEITENNELVFALMAAALIASGTSKLICRKSLFNALTSNVLKTINLEK